MAAASSVVLQALTIIAERRGLIPARRMRGTADAAESLHVRGSATETLTVASLHLQSAHLRTSMKDLVFVAVTVAFFTLSWFYVKAFDRL